MSSKHHNHPKFIYWFPLLSNGKLFGKNYPVGSPQIAIGITNEYLGTTSKFGDRFKLEDEQTEYPHLNIYIRFTVGMNSRKFSQFLDAMIDADEDVAKAHKALLAAKQAIIDAQATNETFYTQLPGYQKLERDVDQKYEQLELAKQGRRSAGQRKLVNALDQEAKQLAAELEKLRKEHAPPIGEDALKALRVEESNAYHAYDDIRSKTLSFQNRQDWFNQYLKVERRLARGLPESMGFIQKKLCLEQMRFCELEFKQSKVKTNRIGTPLVGEDRNGQLHMLTIPYDLLLKAISKEHQNTLCEARDFFACAPRMDDNTHDDDAIKDVDVVYLGDFAENIVLLLRKKQLHEIIRNIDGLMEGGLMSWIMLRNPDPTHPKKPKEESPVAEAQGEPAEGQTEASSAEPQNGSTTMGAVADA